MIHRFLNCAQFWRRKKTKKNPFFERQHFSDKYYHITNTGEVSISHELGNSFDLACYDNANYCTDEELLKQRALEEILARRLWRYSMEHSGDKIYWSDGQCKYVIYYDAEDGLFYTTSNTICQTINTTYFVDRETALNAIKEVVEPFIKEYPGFKSYRTHSARDSKGE